MFGHVTEPVMKTLTILKSTERGSLKTRVLLLWRIWSLRASNIARALMNRKLIRYASPSGVNCRNFPSEIDPKFEYSDDIAEGIWHVFMASLIFFIGAGTAVAVVYWWFLFIDWIKNV